MKCVYLIHFDKPYKHAKHYIGFTKDFERRMDRHRRGDGAVLLRTIQNAGIGWQVVRVWENAKQDVERHIKDSHNSARFCPICNPKRAANNLWRG